MGQDSNKPLNKITEKTVIPLSLAVMVIGGGAAWLTDVHAEVQHQSAQIQDIDADRSDISKKLTDILIELSEIRTELRLKRGRRSVD